MDKRAALSKLERQRDAATELMNADRKNPAFPKWHRNMEVLIGTIFGPTGTHLAKFRKVSYSLSVASTNTPDSAFEKAYQRGLREAQALLDSFVEEIKEFWEDEAAAAAPADTGAWSRSTPQPTNLEAAELMTDIFSRNRFDRDLQDLVAHTRDEGPLALAMIDVDDFKSINDTHSHAVGDDVLRRIATTIRLEVLGRGRVYRYGGEELTILLPNHTTSEAIPLLERVRARVQSTAMPPGVKQVTVSIGVAECAAGSQTPEVLGGNADRALYESKQSGKNCVTATASGHTEELPPTTVKPVEIQLFHRRVATTPERHDYSLEIRLLNNTERLISDYHVDIEMPRGIVEDVGNSALRVRERDSQSHVLLRVTAKDHRDKPLFPGDPTLVFSCPYVMDDARFKIKELLQEPIRVVAFVGGRVIRTTKLVHEVTEF